MNEPTGPCFLCGRQRPPEACCEDWDRIVKAVKVRKPGRKHWERPQRIAMCKDCCIGPLEGHQCVVGFLLALVGLVLGQGLGIVGAPGSAFF